jgi:hypothetical protein
MHSMLRNVMLHVGLKMTGYRISSRKDMVADRGRRAGLAQSDIAKFLVLMLVCW